MRTTIKSGVAVIKACTIGEREESEKTKCNVLMGNLQENSGE